MIESSSTIPWRIDLAYVVPCYFDQQDTDSLDELLRHYADYPAEILDRLQFVVVDDGSPTRIELPDDLDLNIRLLRVTEDINWNQGGARNLGMLYAQCDKVLMTDLDHMVSEQTFAYLLKRSTPKRSLFRLHRQNADGTECSPHPNTFFIARSRFLGLFGYDEEFTGEYGYEDGMFSRWQRYNGTWHRFLPKQHAIRRRKLDEEKSYHSLQRDKTVNRELKFRKLKEWRRWGPRGGHSRRFLEFQWVMVEDRRRRNTTWQPPRNRLWKPLWPLRALFGL